MIPTVGPLSAGLDLGLQELRVATRALSSGAAPLFLYAIETLGVEDGRFLHRGLAPNFQGGIITLCGSNERMRAHEDVRQAGTGGVWIAGFYRGSQSGYSGNWLSYLMRANSVPSQADAWDRLPEWSREAKAADLHRAGDLYRPKEAGLSGNDRYDPSNYLPPRYDHLHAGSRWRSDIDSGRSRQPAILIGDPNMSFIWSRPRLMLHDSVETSLRRGEQRSDLVTILRRFQEQG